MDGFLYRCRNDPSYTMLYISDGVLTVSGFAPSDFIENRTREYVSVIHPEDLARVYSAVDTALEARCNWNVDYRIVPLFGPPLWVREIGGGVLNKAGDLEFLEGFVIDVSDRKIVEDRNDELLRDLKIANEELSEQQRQLERAKQQSDHSANHDLLTGLPNRRAFHNKLDSLINRSTEDGTASCLLFIDLDRFKEVNDTLGHEAGDAVLQRVSDRLRSVLRSGDFVARLGGDEFAFLLCVDAKEINKNAVSVAGRILKELRMEVPSPNGVIRIGCTVGVAVCPADAGDANGLITLADQLMYLGKKRGRNRFVTTEDLEREA
jgi:diguanylate cyclase (GGDEF)-like protein